MRSGDSEDLQLNILTIDRRDFETAVGERAIQKVCKRCTMQTVIQRSSMAWEKVRP